jgi:hypothetical protein
MTSALATFPAAVRNSASFFALQHCKSRDPAVSQLSSFVAAPLCVAPSVHGALQSTTQQLIYSGWECHTIEISYLFYASQCLTEEMKLKEGEQQRNIHVKIKTEHVLSVLMIIVTPCPV